MGGWRKIERLNASEGVLERDVQAIFDAWGSDNIQELIAGAPDWLWALGTPEQQRGRVGYGHTFTPDVLWSARNKAVVAEIKYGRKNEPLAIGEAVHHGYMLRLLEGFSQVTPLVITQYCGWVRAAVYELKGSGLRHVEVDLLKAFGGRLLWVTDPHATVEKCAAPKELPLDKAWKARRWWRVADEETWLVHEKPGYPFTVGPLAIISKARSTQQRYVLWSGRMPGRDEKWSGARWRAAGTYWSWSPEGDSRAVPPLPE